MRDSQRIKQRLTVTAATGLLFGLSACELYVVDDASQLPQQPVQPILLAEPTPPPEPLPGSELVLFMDSTTAQLNGCRAISNIRFSHHGSYVDGMTILRNAAIQINGNRMVPIRLLENVENRGGTHLYHVKLMRCPEPDTQGTESNG
tara:strand:- start:1039 stop:1479 length:441 start_codon:yes stop_codon:yes gene_type:complete